jgi:hypothetical protein
MPEGAGLVGQVEAFVGCLVHESGIGHEAVGALTYEVDVVVRHEEQVWRVSVFCFKADNEIGVVRARGRGGLGSMRVQDRAEALPDVDFVSKIVLSVPFRPGRCLDLYRCPSQAAEGEGQDEGDDESNGGRPQSRP